jgi:hypothetical protein
MEIFIKYFPGSSSIQIRMDKTPATAALRMLLSSTKACHPVERRIGIKIPTYENIEAGQIPVL